MLKPFLENSLNYISLLQKKIFRRYTQLQFDKNVINIP